MWKRSSWYDDAEVEPVGPVHQRRPSWIFDDKPEPVRPPPIFKLRRVAIITPNTELHADVPPQLSHYGTGIEFRCARYWTELRRVFTGLRQDVIVFEPKAADDPPAVIKETARIIHLCREAKIILIASRSVLPEQAKQVWVIMAHPTSRELADRIRALLYDP